VNDFENDFESKVKTLLNERVDAKIGTSDVPRFAPPGNVRPIGSARRRAPWVLPLLAAACVAAIVGGSVGAAHLLAGKHTKPVGPATHNVPAPRHTPAPKDTPTLKGDQSGLLTVEGATLPLPAGWLARDYKRYEPPPVQGQLEVADEGWCLTPASTPVKVGGCPIWFRAFAHPSTQQGPLMDVDERGGNYGDAHQVCIPSGTKHYALQAGEVPFGGRLADYRHWRYDCVSGPAFVAEQYVVATRPAYIIFSEQVDATVHQVMSDLAAHASLPPSATTLRYEDYGYVRSIMREADGVHVSIDRTVRDVAADSDHTTYDYVVPTRMYAAAAKDVKVGKLAQVETDGDRVIMFSGYAR
jgi:hypothetical protein